MFGRTPRNVARPYNLTVVDNIYVQNSQITLQLARIAQFHKVEDQIRFPGESFTTIWKKSGSKIPNTDNLFTIPTSDGSFSVEVTFTTPQIRKPAYVLFASTFTVSGGRVTIINGIPAIPPTSTSVTSATSTTASTASLSTVTTTTTSSTTSLSTATSTTTKGSITIMGIWGIIKYV